MGATTDQQKRVADQRQRHRRILGAAVDAEYGADPWGDWQSPIRSLDLEEQLRVRIDQVIAEDEPEAGVLLEAWTTDALNHTLAYDCVPDVSNLGHPAYDAAKSLRAFERSARPDFRPAEVAKVACQLMHLADRVALDE